MQIEYTKLDIDYWHLDDKTRSAQGGHALGCTLKGNKTDMSWWEFVSQSRAREAISTHQITRNFEKGGFRRSLITSVINSYSLLQYIKSEYT